MRLNKISSAVLSLFLLNGCASYKPSDFETAHDYLKASLTTTVLGIEVPITSDQEVFLFRNRLFSTTQVVQSNANFYSTEDVRFVTYSNEANTDQLKQPLINAQKYCDGHFKRISKFQGEFFFEARGRWALYNDTTSYQFHSRSANIMAASNSKSIQEALFVSDAFFGRFECKSNIDSWVVSINPTAFFIDYKTSLPTFSTGMVVRVIQK